MADHEIRDSSTTDGLPVAPSMGPALESARMPREPAPVGRRVVGVAAGIAGALVEAVSNHGLDNLTVQVAASVAAALVA